MYSHNFLTCWGFDVANAHIDDISGVFADADILAKKLVIGGAIISWRAAFAKQRLPGFSSLRSGRLAGEKLPKYCIWPSSDSSKSSSLPKDLKTSFISKLFCSFGLFCCFFFLSFIGAVDFALFSLCGFIDLPV